MMKNGMMNGIEENSIPKRIKLSLFINFEKNKSPKTYSRIIDIPGFRK